jgi:hypothetical protein
VTEYALMIKLVDGTSSVLKRKKQISGHFDMKTATYKMHHRKVIEDKQTCVKSFNTVRRM